MSFNINGPSNKPIIQEAQNMMNNGGGGNLGYFQRGNDENDLQIKKDDGVDSFEKIRDEEILNDDSSMWEKIVEFFKAFFGFFLGKDEEKIEKNEAVDLSKENEK